jgi:hypothetical protein
MSKEKNETEKKKSVSNKTKKRAKKNTPIATKDAKELAQKIFSKLKED